MPLAALLKARIAEGGPITLAEFMEAALAHPEFGYYMTRDPFGKDGDFMTAPEISQIFGELLGAWLAAQWQASGSPRACLLELGPGRGTLMRDMRRATKQVPGFHESLSIVMCETSPVLEALQRKTLAQENISWVRDLAALPDLPLFFIANEFFDALPIRQWVDTEERKIHVENGHFAFTLEGVIRETCEPAAAIMQHLASHVRKRGGAGLVIDYGYASGQGDTLQAVKDHAYIDPLEAPGEADLTAHVDFAALAHAAQGASVYGPVPQGTFLKRLGAELRAAALCKQADAAQREAILSGLERLVAPHTMGELFKVLAITHPSLAMPEGFK